MASVLSHEADDKLERSSNFYASRRGMRGSMSHRRRTKLDICERYIQYLRERNHVDADRPGFASSVQQHFESLPTRYALDVDTAGPEILRHMQLLEQARKYPESVAFMVREIELLYPKQTQTIMKEKQGFVPDSTQLVTNGPISNESRSGRHRSGLRPSFPSSSSLQNLTDLADYMAATDDTMDDIDAVPMKEIIIAAKDRLELLSHVAKAMSDADLDIREAHVFNTDDGYSFDVFVVESAHETTPNDLQMILRNAFHQTLTETTPIEGYPLSGDDDAQMILNQPSNDNSRMDDFEVDIQHLQLLSKIASSTFGHVYKGHYYGQEVAVKIIKDVTENTQMKNEFMQEVAIMKKVRHRNVVQFIGACTVEPSLCILFEYMEGGSVHDYLRKGPLSLLEILKIALDVARGMDYLHQRKIIHRDLKAANLLIDGTGTVKIADFGVAKILDNACCSTAETGTYRWMAPEVIEHKEYNHKVDVFSFSILLWELMTGEVPYNGQTPISAAVSVVQRDMRPPIPQHCPVHLAHLMHACWARNPSTRPEFTDIARTLQGMFDAEKQNADLRRTSMYGGTNRGLLSMLRRQGGSR